MGSNSAIRFAMLIAFAALLLQGTGSHAASRESNAEVILVSFGGTYGELKDCGCHGNPMGGLSHRASFLDSLRVRGKQFLLVDLGDFMSTENVVADVKNRFQWKKMEEMGYRVSTPGVREISDWRRYRELLADSPIRPVATNLTVIDNGREEPAGPAYRIETTNGVRVAFFSLMGPQELSKAAPPQGLVFRVRDPLATANEIVPRLRKMADLVVLMSQMSGDQTDALLGEVKGIDVALYGREPEWKDAAIVKSATIVQETGIRGAQVGELVLIVDPAGEIVEWGSRNDALGDNYGEDPGLSAEVENLENEAKEMITRDQQRKATGSEAPAGTPGGKP
jgi:2',3'-cyclic-nucleotide 2'-phosphodiesterase (5'-nucleotidase family)